MSQSFAISKSATVSFFFFFNTSFGNPSGTASHSIKQNHGLNLARSVKQNSRHGRSMHIKLVAQLCLTVTPWTKAHQQPLSMEFSRQEYQSGLPFSSLEDLPDLGIEPRSPAFQADSTI